MFTPPRLLKSLAHRAWRGKTLSGPLALGMEAAEDGARIIHPAYRDRPFWAGSGWRRLRFERLRQRSSRSQT